MGWLTLTLYLNLTILCVLVWTVTISRESLSFCTSWNNRVFVCYIVYADVWGRIIEGWYAISDASFADCKKAV